MQNDVRATEVPIVISRLNKEMTVNVTTKPVKGNVDYCL